MNCKNNIDFKDNNELINCIYRVLSRANMNMHDIIEFIGPSTQRRLASDLITLQPKSFNQIKAINIVHAISSDEIVLSVIVIFKDHSLKFNEIEKKFGLYKVYENGRDPSYEIIFEGVESPFQFVKLYTLPLQYTDNVRELINNSYSWFSAIEFGFGPHSSASMQD